MTNAIRPRLKEIQIPFNPEWEGFNGYLLHVPRAALIEEYSPDNPNVMLVGLYSRQSDDPATYRRFSITKDLVTHEWGSQDRWVEITDNTAILYTGSRAGSRSTRFMLMRWERFLTPTGMSIWEITGEDRWHNVAVDARNLLPATWATYFQQLNIALAQATLRVMGEYEPGVRYTPQAKFPDQWPTGLTAHNFYREMISDLESLSSPETLRRCLKQIQLARDLVQTHGRLRRYIDAWPVDLSEAY